MKIKTKNELGKKAWDWDKAKHLLNRAGFGGKPTEIGEAVTSGFESTLRHLFDLEHVPYEKPDWLSDYSRMNLSGMHKMSRDQRRDFMHQSRERIRGLQMDWILRLIDSRNPAEMLWNKMTFFWHSHFATSVQKVKLAPIIFQQLALFHNHAVGNFRDLLFLSFKCAKV